MLTWAMIDDSRTSALGASGTLYVITADHDSGEDDTSYTLIAGGVSHSRPSLVRLILDAEALEEINAAKRSAAA